MSCLRCQGYVDNNGKCYTWGCENSRRQAVYPRPALGKKSARKKREESETRSIRAITKGERCEICNAASSLESHEIPAGSYRHIACYDRRTQLRVCRQCHEKIQGLPYAAQVAAKVRAMIAGINAAHGSKAVTSEDVREKLT